MDSMRRPLRGWMALAERRHENVWAYREAARIVLDSFGSVDGMLARGGLETQAAERQLHLATGEPTRSPQPWGPLYVKGLNHKAVWPQIESAPPEDRWAIASAEAFLRVTASLKSGVIFTW